VELSSLNREAPSKPPGAGVGDVAAERRLVRRVYELVQRETDRGTGFDHYVREGLLDANMEWRGAARGARAVAGMENVVGWYEYLEMVRRVQRGFLGPRSSRSATRSGPTGAGRAAATFLRNSDRNTLSVNAPGP
jgi:hypothetical protein